MGFRTLEINEPASLHVRKGQLEITQEQGTVYIAIEDLESLILAGPDIRVSSNALAAVADGGAMVVCCGRNHTPSAFFLSTRPNARQALLARQQIELTDSFKDSIWQSIVKKKIENQARALSILGKSGVSDVASHVSRVTLGDVNNAEGSAARIYFPLLHEGLNRRNPDPFNSVLNYGYAILRSSIVRKVVSSGFITCLGIHHDNQLNNFNLADDLIEPFRPMVDIVAPQIIGTSTWLSKEQRHALANVLHHACIMNGRETTILKAITLMVDSFRRAVTCSNPNSLELPTLINIKYLSEVIE